MPSSMLKAGTLDDPVWGEPVKCSSLRKRRLRNPRRSIFVLGALSALLAIGLILWLSRSNHPGGDPGGRILKGLEPASAGVPSGSTDVVTHLYDSIWSPACPDNPAGQAGWSEVMVNTSFTTL
jgi:hypothetical protein